MTKYIGIGHYSKVGKTELAGAIAHKLYTSGHKAAEYPLARSLKYIVHQMYWWAGVGPEEYYEKYRDERYNPIEKLGGMTYIDLLVKVGTNAIRDQVWRDTWLEMMKAATKEDEYVIIPDIRFRNEANFIKTNGGILIKATRIGYAPLDTVADRSLAGYDGWDWHATNNSDLNEWREKGDRLAYKIIEHFDEQEKAAAAGG